MNNLLTRIIGDKKDWKRMEARAAQLPGSDLAAFCDARLPEQHDAYRAKLRADLNAVVRNLS
ncbi:hypothetical protein [Nocardioides sp.]|uniref:hypothetical protein n=1 Tax=Nocardioides sp. TaxID=35761 RepID=UPI00199A7F33|nr:hypothetical protein [Nocardioides sp.]MBC7275720.1 hypothetical protein [Nocardioides sp.]